MWSSGASTRGGCMPADMTRTSPCCSEVSSRIDSMIHVLQGAETSFRAAVWNAALSAGAPLNSSSLPAGAKLLKAREADLKGTVLLLFQPGECDELCNVAYFPMWSCTATQFAACVPVATRCSPLARPAFDLHRPLSTAR